jgi:hypothetical protein
MSGSGRLRGDVIGVGLGEHLLRSLLGMTTGEQPTRRLVAGAPLRFLRRSIANGWPARDALREIERTLRSTTYTGRPLQRGRHGLTQSRLTGATRAPTRICEPLAPPTSEVSAFAARPRLALEQDWVPPAGERLGDSAHSAPLTAQPPRRRGGPAYPLDRPASSLELASNRPSTGQ